MRLVVCFALLLIADVIAADELVFVQAIWRHGDRNPKYVCPKDVYNQYWYQGLGQITAVGEKQHFDLGRQIYDEYVTKQKFLNPAYKMEDVYFRSTDVNRTLLSAYSNLLGMYYNRAANPVNVTYPAVTGWPPGFVPVAVHTVLRKLDHILNVEPECPRRQYLLEQLMKTKEYTDYIAAKKMTLKSATDVCGAPIDIFNIWRLTESYITEKAHRVPFIDQASFNAYREVEMKAQGFANGQGVSVTDTPYGKIDFAKELLTVRSGGLIRDIIDHMDEKITCLDPKMVNETSCKWVGKLKYFAYSSHWATINALLTALGARDKIIPNDLPDFAAAFFIELWKTSAGGYVIKAKFRDGPTKPLRDVTASIAGCTSALCAYMTFKETLLPFYPTNIEELCKTVPAGWKPTAEVKQPAQSTKQGLIDNKTSKRVTRLAPNQLLFVQMFWRHGDRTPTNVCPKDVNKESTWKEGYGQLTALGMEQQRRLGDMIFDKYVTDGQFLDGTFNASQIYIRSTDFNRTIASAISNFVGFYYNRSASLLDRDFPGPDWPNKFTAVPIHTVNRFTDHMGDPNTYCPRQLELMKYATDSEEVRSLGEKNKDFLAMVSEKCGQSVGLMDLVMPVDSWYIEKIHNRPRIFTDEEYNKMRELDRIAENIRHGLLNNSMLNGINLRVQIPRMRGGSQLYNIIDHMEQKIYCMEHPEAGDDVCGWYTNLKYFAFSAHDSTLNGLLSALGAKETVVPDDIPEYAAAIAFELWMNGGQYEIRVNYHRNYESTAWEDITGDVGGCPKDEMCLWDKFKERSLPYNPGNIDELCSDVSGLHSTTVPPTTTSSANTITSFSYLVFLAVIFAKLM